MAEPLIRRARPGDESGIHAAHMRSIREICVKDHGPEEIRVWGNRPLGDRWVGPIRDAHVWVVELEGVIHGHAFLRVLEEAGRVHAHVHGLYLTPEAVGRGLASRLVELMLAEARRAGALEVTLESTLTAHGFYARAGFRDTGPPAKMDLGDSQVTYIPMALPLGRVAT
jgi:GNAT superfamily N-acetyltransferase